jgi:flagellar biosynthesis protein FlhB
VADETFQEKTEQATPRKRQEAHDEGQIPKSQELNTAFVLLASALILKVVAPVIGSALTTTMKTTLLLTAAPGMNSEAVVEVVRGIGWKVLAALSAFLLAVGGSTLAVAGVQARGVLSAKPLGPNWKRLDPIANGKRMLGAQPWMELAKSLLKLLIVSVCVYFSLKAAWGDSMSLAQKSPIALIVLIQSYAVRLLFTAGMAYLALAGLDYAYQLWQHEKKLKMSKEEVKKEHKQMEGDPLIKAQRRAMGRAMARRQMFQEVPQADVVITNPTHIAVALKYDPQRADAPIVLAMGQRMIAERIKAIAAEAGVPMVENKPLARALLASARVGTMIPSELYVAVAEVLAWVMGQRQGRRPVEAS